MDNSFSYSNKDRNILKLVFIVWIFLFCVALTAASTWNQTDDWDRGEFEILSGIESDDTVKSDDFIEQGYSHDPTTYTPKCYEQNFEEKFDLSSNLLYCWEFDEGSGSTVTEHIGGDEHSISGATWSRMSRVNNNSLHFENGDYVGTGITEPLPSDEWTVNAWVRPDDYSDDWNRFIGNHWNNNNKGFAIGLSSDGVNQNWQFCCSGPSTSSNTELGEWKMVTAVYDGSNYIAYIDANNVGSGSTSYTPQDGVDLHLGDSGGYDEQWEGNIGRIRIYDKALSVSELEELAQGGAVNEKYPRDRIVKFSFEESGNVRNILSGRDYSSSVSRIAGIQGSQGARFSGSEDIGFGGTVSNPTYRTNEIALSVWVKNMEGNSWDENFLSNYDSNGVIFRGNGNCGNGGFANYVDSGDIRTCDVDITNDDWHHVVFNYDSGNKREIWVDGVKKASDSVSRSLGSRNYYLGNRQDSDCCLDSDIDEYEVFSKALSDNEIEKIYNAGRNGHLVTDWRNFDQKWSQEDLKLDVRNFDTESHNIEISIQTDPDRDGVVEDSSDLISLENDNYLYNVSGINQEFDRFKMQVLMNTTDSEVSPYLDRASLSNLVVTVNNQTGEPVQGANISIMNEGTDQIVNTATSNYCSYRTDENGQMSCGLNKTDIYKVLGEVSNFQNEFLFRNVRVPDELNIGNNQNFVPESTMDNSLKFGAGQVLPAQTMITRPFSDFDVVNVSVEKNLDESYRMVSDVLVRKYNVNFESGWQDWSNRKTVDIQEIYNRDWDDSGGEMNNAWGVITFNPEGFQNNDCSDVRLTDTDNNVQDFTINTCDDDYVEMEFNAPINSLEEKEFYVYYGNSGASDAQTAVQRPSETRQFDMETGATGTADTYFYQDNSGGTKGFNTTIPQNIDFIERSMTVEGDRTKPRTNDLPVNLDTDYEDFTGMEIEPQRRYILHGITIQMASTTVDSELVIRNQSSGNNIMVKEIPDNGAGEYFINYTNESIQRTGENQVLSPGDRFLVFLRYGEARRASNTETQRPMFDLTDTTFHRQFLGLNSDGTSGAEGDYPVLVSQIETIDPEYPRNVTITHDNTGQQVYNGPDQLNDQQTVDLTSFLDAEEWREGDPLDSPKLHEFSVESDTDGNLSLTFDTRVEFEHPVTTVSKSASGCAVNPESQTYFHVDRSDCSYLDRVNVSEGQWFRLDYRFRTPGPNDFDAPGDVNSYNISDTIVRFDILQETEEFTSG